MNFFLSDFAKLILCRICKDSRRICKHSSEYNNYFKNGIRKYFTLLKIGLKIYHNLKRLRRDMGKFDSVFCFSQFLAFIHLSSKFKNTRSDESSGKLLRDELIL